MRQDQQSRPLCPHLAAAALWMTKSSRPTARVKNGNGSARAYGWATDDLLAL